MKLILVRHGQTEQNKNRIWQGHSEGMLNEEGKEQAKKLADRLEKENIDVIYCSDLQRTRNTIKPYLKKNNTPIYYAEELRERNLGVLEGATTEQIEEYMTKNNINFDNTNFETGETSPEFKGRVFKLYSEVLNKHENETVLFVSHGGTIAQIMLHLFNHSKGEFKAYVPNNTGITKIEVKKGKPKLLVFNDIRHL